ncbi:MAG: hypothetical protein IKY02_05560, partial [Lachnospiraceae bacterium]|nr:hypothetical protein [Lachnospiraceae bacterium]
MKTMKKWMAAALSLLLVLGLFAGCTAGTPTAAPTSAPTAKPTEAPTEEPFTGEEQFLEREPGCNQLTLYWKGTADVATSDVWMWWDGKDGSGHLFTKCAYGLKCMVNVPEEITEVGFIVRTHCSEPGGTSWGEATKDFADDRFAVMTGPDTVIYLKSQDGAQYESTDGGKTLTEVRAYKLAGLISPTEIKYSIAPAKRIASLDEVKVTDGEGNVLTIESLSSLNNEVVTGTLKMKEPLDLSKTYTLEIKDYGKKTVMPTTIFDSADFEALYAYDGN